MTRYRPNRIPNILNKIANNLFKIKHWQFQLGDYRDIQNQEATWFIDPPYQHGGENYKHHDIDYQELAEWCKSRKGQVIVCENTKADWLPFHPMKKINGTANTKTTEAIWSNLKTGYEYHQMPMFDPIPSPSES